MKGTNSTVFKRTVGFFMSMIIMVSCIPDNIHSAFAAEVQSAADAVSEVIENIEDEETAPTEEVFLEYQTISASPSEDNNDIVTLDGLMPSNATVNVSSIDSTLSENLCAYNISITDNRGSEYQPENGNTIKVDITSTNIGEAVSSDSKLRLWHIDDNGIREEIHNFKVYNDTITFEAKGFSVYEVDNGKNPVRTYKFMMQDANSEYAPYYFPTSSKDQNGNYKNICKQIIKNGEKLVFPKLPADINSNHTFVGWFEYDKDTDTLAEEPFNFDKIDPINGPDDEEVELRAVFKSCVYVIFHDQFNGRTSSFPVSATRRGTLEPGIDSDNSNFEHTVINIKDYTVSYDDQDAQDANMADGQPPQMQFIGWTDLMKWPFIQLTAEEKEGKTQAEIRKIMQDKIAALTKSNPQAIHNYLENSNVDVCEDTVDISNTTRLYPVFEPIRWLEFVSSEVGSGATYIPPKRFNLNVGYSFKEKDPDTGSPAKPPVREGYNFTGWFTEEGVQVTDANLDILDFTDTTGKLYRSGDRLFVNSNLTDSAGKKIVQVKLKAGWQPIKSNYTVIIWKQKITDTADMDVIDDRNFFPGYENTPEGNAQYEEMIAGLRDQNKVKSYDFADAITITSVNNVDVLTEDIASVANSYKQMDYPGFYFNSCNTDKQVAGDGSTVLNVYYDRCNVVYRFFSSQYSWTPATTWEGLYGQPVSMYGKSWDKTSAWYYKKVSNKGITYLDAFDVIDSSYSNYNQSTKTYTVDIFKNGNNNGGDIIHILQDLDGNYSLSNTELVKETKSDTSSYSFTLTNKFDGFDVVGYTLGSFKSTPDYLAGVNTDVSVKNQTLYVYHQRKVNTITFMNPKHKVYKEYTVKYNAPLDSYANEPYPTDADDGEQCTGWYYDDGAKVKIDFDGAFMPNANVAVYSGYEKIWHLITLDPNGGELPDGQSTWFWETHDGDPVEEYKTASRNYEPDVNGTFYYSLHDRNYYNLGNEWNSSEDSIKDRSAKYTTDASLSTDAVRYGAVDGAYRYLGWYEVIYNEAGEEIGEKVYNFSERVTRNLHLRLHWKQLGTYNIQYNAGEGVIDDQDSNETTFSFLDADDYSDHADIVVTRVAKDPSGKKNFVGWRIRNDSTEKIYYPGQSFQFSSSYAVPIIVCTDPNTNTYETKNTIFLDAVYEEISNTSIIYDPNGGTVSADALSATHSGGPLNPNNEIATTYEITDNQLVVGDIVNNATVQLSNGTGFTNGAYTFLGWSTEKDGSENFYDQNSILNGQFRADNNDPLVLYAQWAVVVYFDKNNSEYQGLPYNGWGGDWTQSGYEFDTGKNQYKKVINLNSLISCPNYNPISTNPELMFHYWSLEKQIAYGTETAPFDFSTTRITQEFLNNATSLTLYGCWKNPIKLPIHVVDTTDKDWALRDSEWLLNGYPKTKIVLNGNPAIFNAATGVTYLKPGSVDTAGNTYDWEFACIGGKGENEYKNLSEDNKVKSLHYDVDSRNIIADMADGTKRVFDPDNEEIYMVYFKSPEQVPVKYVEMATNGPLSNISTKTGSPNYTMVYKESAAHPATDIRNVLQTPLSYPTKNYGYYSYAIGPKNAADTTDLVIITNYADNDSNRPLLKMRNTWKGFQYTLAEDPTESDWVDCGYDVAIYAVYFEQRPTIVNLTEKTFALPGADMDTKFTYSIVIKKTTHETKFRNYYYGNNNSKTPFENNNHPKNKLIGTTSNTSIISSSTIDLADGDNVSYVLLYTQPTSTDLSYTIITGDYYYYPNYYTPQQVYYRDTVETYITQTIEIVQTLNESFKTENDAVSGDHIYQSSFTSSADSETQTITYTNTKITSKPVNVALLQGSTITDATSGMRTSNSSVYEHTFNSAETWNISDKNVISPEALINYNSEYVLVDIISGSESDGNITKTYDGISSISYGQLSDGSYGFYLSGNPAKVLGENEKVWFVYTKKPKIRYVFKKPDGSYEQFSPLLRNGTEFRRDVTDTFEGTKAQQNEILPVTHDNGLLIAQITSPASPAFVVPGDLDYGGNPLILDLERMAVGSASGSAADADTAKCEFMKIKAENGALQYSFGNSAESAAMPEDPVVYAIYEIKGYDLTITKTVIGDANGKSEFTFNVHSEQPLNSSNYFISVTDKNGDTQVSTISAVNLTVTVEVENGGSATIYGLQSGIYTLTEANTGNCEVKATVNGVEAAVKNDTLGIAINDDTSVDVVNNYPIPVTGANDNASPYIAVIAVITMVAAVFWIKRRKEEMFNENASL